MVTYNGNFHINNNVGNYIDENTIKLTFIERYTIVSNLVNLKEIKSIEFYTNHDIDVFYLKIVWINTANVETTTTESENNLTDYMQTFDQYFPCGIFGKGSIVFNDNTAQATWESQGYLLGSHEYVGKIHISNVAEDFVYDDNFIHIYNMKTPDYVFGFNYDKMNSIIFGGDGSHYWVTFFYEYGGIARVQYNYYADISLLTTYLTGVSSTGFDFICYLEYTDPDNIRDIGIDSSANCIFLYRMNSPKIQVNKDLIFVQADEMKYTRPIQYKQMIIDVKRSANDLQYNYVYLTVLNRYYYITDVVLMNDFASCSLVEDVLMSFKDLIYSQTAFVERQENTYNLELKDNYVSFDEKRVYTFTTITPNYAIYGVPNTAVGCYIIQTIHGVHI